MVVAARATAVAARATAAADWEMTVAAITMAGLARATVPVCLARAALARARVEQAMEAAASEQSLSVSQACSNVICGTSTTSRVDSAPAWLSSGFCARASRSRMDLLRRTALSASPAQRKKKMSCAHEAHVSTRAARWRRPARSRRSRSRRWQAMGVERGGEEGACPAVLRVAGSLQASSKP